MTHFFLYLPIKLTLKVAFCDLDPVTELVIADPGLDPTAEPGLDPTTRRSSPISITLLVDEGN